MSKSRIATIADYVVQELNSLSWSQSFTAERRYIAEYTDKQLETLKVIVIAGLDTPALLSRGILNHTHVVYVTIQKRVDPTVTADIDALAYLGEEITKYYAWDSSNNGHRKLAGLSTSHITSAINDPICDPKVLSENRRFFGGVVLTINENERA